MKTINIKKKTKINGIKPYEADYLEKMIEKRMTGEDIVVGGKGVIFTEREDGVISAHNIRTDRFEEAMEAMDRITARKIAGKEGFEERKKSIETPNGDASVAVAGNEN